MTVAVAIGDKVFAQQAHANRRSFAFGHFLRQQCR